MTSDCFGPADLTYLIIDKRRHSRVAADAAAEQHGAPRAVPVAAVLATHHANSPSTAELLICPSGGMFGPRSNDPDLQPRSHENRVPNLFVHPADFPITDPIGEIRSRTILGDHQDITSNEIGGDTDQPARSISKERSQIWIWPRLAD